ncbi:ankyrin repeat domain-containing protein [Alienimonas californiensis]|uniref:Phosphocholine transferase AnkX n=1 Tax=Alienimonas californiensis TaxID=2527989 RepID=A0A517P6L7_9PLAN|nr:ankyrin repeat domain-containing protein [Alienimonas californiensis]QDT15003.1 Phosphocholine transferase AnkX [Alienimonas californiensis]
MTAAGLLLVCLSAPPDAAPASTPLHDAAALGDAAAVTRLLSEGAAADAVNRYGVTPLSLACEAGDEACVTALLNAGADPNRTAPGGETPLMTAARTGAVGALNALLKAGAKANATERAGQTALMWAAAAGNGDAVDRLLAAGADRDARTPGGFTALLFAVREGRADIARRLLAAGADVNAGATVEKRPGDGLESGTTPLGLAVENGHFALAAALLEAGADPNGRSGGVTALHAISKVRKPLGGDGDPPPRGSGALGSLTFARQLVAAGADVDARLKSTPRGRPGINKAGATPFILACEACDAPLMAVLLELGADETLKTNDGATPLLAAAGVGPLGSGDEPAGTEAEAVEAVTLLLDRGADLAAVDGRGDTVMHGAAYKNRPAVVRLLAERGADPADWNRKNRRGQTPLEIARGHRPGNFRPHPPTEAALLEVLGRP